MIDILLDSDLESLDLLLSGKPFTFQCGKYGTKRFYFNSFYLYFISLGLRHMLTIIMLSDFVTGDRWHAKTSGDTAGTHLIEVFDDRFLTWRW